VESALAATRSVHAAALTIRQRDAARRAARFRIVKRFNDRV
jgi:hypothetical protein